MPDNSSVIKRKNHLFVCYQFLKQLRSKYGRKPVCTDGAHWYDDDDACKWLRLKHFVYEIEMKKNLMERFLFNRSKTGDRRMFR
jgi:hypothetical protein